MTQDSSEHGNMEVPDKDIIQAIQSASDPVLSTAEVADACDIKERGTRARLNRLEDEGKIESKKVGGKVWWTEEDREDSQDDSSKPERVITAHQYLEKNGFEHIPNDDYLRQGLFAAFKTFEESADNSVSISHIRNKLKRENYPESMWEAIRPYFDANPHINVRGEDRRQY